MPPMRSQDGPPLPLAGDVYRAAQLQAFSALLDLYHGVLLLLLCG